MRKVIDKDTGEVLLEFEDMNDVIAFHYVNKEAWLKQIEETKKWDKELNQRLLYGEENG